MSDEKYVTLTEALEWEKRVRSEMSEEQMSEDELYEALATAKDAVERWGRSLQGTAAATVFEPEGWLHPAMALLEAARWFTVHEYSYPDRNGVRVCVDCYGEPPNHLTTCTVGRWVRAAERAGL